MKHRSLRVAALSLGLVLCSATSCTEQDKAFKDVPDAAARRELFKNLADRVIAPTYADFTKAAGVLAKATSAYAGSVSEADLEAAQAGFAGAMLIWQRAEVFQVGPSASVTNSAPGAQGLRQEIYAWATVSRCGISRALVDKSYAEPKAFAELSQSVRGLGTLEILLFDDSTDSGCAKTNSIVSSGAWDKLGTAELAKRRALYAKSAAADLVSRATNLEKAWRSFTAELASAGNGSELFEGTQDALNALTDALFYIDTETKDMKLARPLGIDGSCAGATCLALVEHPYAKISKASILANLEAFRDVFRGLPPASRGTAMWGLKDLLLSISADKLAKNMDARIDSTLAALADIESLETALEMSDAKPMRAYIELQTLTDLLKTQFIAVLSLKAPMSASGDND